jgi:hypothetical protein
LTVLSSAVVVFSKVHPDLDISDICFPLDSSYGFWERRSQAGEEPFSSSPPKLGHTYGPCDTCSVVKLCHLAKLVSNRFLHCKVNLVSFCLALLCLEASPKSNPLLKGEVFKLHLLQIRVSMDIKQNSSVR